jgi:hypothetical protein
VLKKWETKLANCKVTPEAIWPIAKFLSKKGWTKGTICSSWSLKPIFYTIEKASIIADCLENLCRPHARFV